MSLVTPQQRLQLEEWLSQSGELFVDVYRHKSAGSSTGYFIHSVADIESIIQLETYPTLLITVFRQLQFRLRGVADKSLLAQALQDIPDGRSFRIASLDHCFPSHCDWLGGGDTHVELREEIASVFGERVCIGPDPLDNDDPKATVYTPPCEVMELSFKRHAGAYVCA